MRFAPWSMKSQNPKNPHTCNKKENTLETKIFVGTIRDKAEIKSVTDAIIRIMEARADQKTIREALIAFRNVAEVKNVTLNGATVHGDNHHHEHFEAPAPAPDIDGDEEGERSESPWGQENVINVTSDEVAPFDPTRNSN